VYDGYVSFMIHFEAIVESLVVNRGPHCVLELKSVNGLLTCLAFEQNFSYTLFTQRV